jgi:hypothetical protein
MLKTKVGLNQTFVKSIHDNEGWRETGAGWHTRSGKM